MLKYTLVSCEFLSAAACRYVVRIIVYPVGGVNGGAFDFCRTQSAVEANWEAPNLQYLGNLLVQLPHGTTTNLVLITLWIDFLDAPWEFH
jgi:hypothetical protein